MRSARPRPGRSALVWFEGASGRTRRWSVAVAARRRVALGARPPAPVAGRAVPARAGHAAPRRRAYLASWDAVQYALGLVDFDVTRHQPHPPGSILYVGAGRLLLALTGDAQTALGGDQRPGRRRRRRAVLRRRAGHVRRAHRRAGDGAVPRLAPHLVLRRRRAAVRPGGRARPGRGRAAVAGRRGARAEGAALGAAALLAVAGGVRQTTMLLLLPLWLYATWRACDLPAPDGSWCRPATWRRCGPRSGRGGGARLGLALMGCSASPGPCPCSPSPAGWWPTSPPRGACLRW